MIISRGAWNALHALAWEFQAKGGQLEGVTPEQIEEALDALEYYETIEIEPEEPTDDE
jgi:hypothetical protein